MKKLILSLSMCFVAIVLLQSQWRVQPSGTTQNLYSVNAISTSNVIAVGYAGTILKFNGSAWQSQVSGTTKSLNGVYFADATHGWAVGDTGTILFTSDGQTWTPQTSNTTANLLAVYFIDATKGWAVGSAGTILKTTDGTTWTVQTSGSISSLLSVGFIDANTGFIGTYDGKILNTSNGTDWAVQTADPYYSVYGMFLLDATHLYGVTYKSKLCAYNGTSWTIGFMSGVTSILHSVYYFNPNVGIYVGGNSSSDIYTTYDAGAHYANIPSPVTSPLMAIDYADSLVGWIVGYNGTILASTDTVYETKDICEGSAYRDKSASGDYIIVKTNASGPDSIFKLKLTVYQPLTTIGSITGATSVSLGQSVSPYSVPALNGAQSYVWTTPSNSWLTGTTTVNSVNVNFSNTAVSGNITVKAKNVCGFSSTSTLAVTINNLPAQAGYINGNGTPCQGATSVSYSVGSITHAESYVWRTTSGLTGSSTTSSILINVASSSVLDTIWVKGRNGDGDGIESFRVITPNILPEAPTYNSGPLSVTNLSTPTYTVNTSSNTTSYIWSLPFDVTGTSTTNSILASIGSVFQSGTIKVKGVNACGQGPFTSIDIVTNNVPNAAGTILGSATVCQGASNKSYTVDAIPYATSYIWTLPNGFTGTSTTNTIVVDVNSTAISGIIKVYGHNVNGDGAESSLSVTVNALPSDVGQIVGTDIVSPGQESLVYSIPAISNATSYEWTLPNGVTGASSSSSITVSFPCSFQSGSISVKGINSCGNASSSALTVNVADFSGLLAKISELKADTLELNTHIEAFLEDSLIAIDSIIQLNADNGALQIETSALKADTAKLNTHIESLIENSLVSINSIVQLDENNSALVLQTNNLKADTVLLNTQIRKLLADSLAALNTVNSLNASIAALQLQIAALKTDTSSLNSLIKILVNDTLVAYNSIGTLKTNIVALKSDTSSKGLLIVDLNNKLAQGKYTKYDTLTVLVTVADIQPVSTNVTIAGIKVDLKLFPNPATQLVNVEISSTVKSYEIYNVNGALLESKTVNSSNFQLNVANISNGDYVLKFVTDIGTITSKLMIKR